MIARNLVKTMRFSIGAVYSFCSFGIVFWQRFGPEEWLTERVKKNGSTIVVLQYAVPF